MENYTLELAANVLSDNAIVGNIANVAIIAGRLMMIMIACLVWSYCRGRQRDSEELKRLSCIAAGMQGG